MGARRDIAMSVSIRFRRNGKPRILNPWALGPSEKAKSAPMCLMMDREPLYMPCVRVTAVQCRQYRSVRQRGLEPGRCLVPPLQITGVGQVSVHHTCSSGPLLHTSPPSQSPFNCSMALQPPSLAARPKPGSSSSTKAVILVPLATTCWVTQLLIRTGWRTVSRHPVQALVHGIAQGMLHPRSCHAYPPR